MKEIDLTRAPWMDQPTLADALSAIDHRLSEIQRLQAGIHTDLQSLLQLQLALADIAPDRSALAAAYRERLVQYGQATGKALPSLLPDVP